MKVGIDFQSFEDVVSIIWCLQHLSLQKIENKREFIFYDSDDSFHFVQNYSNNISDEIKDYDLKIKALHTFESWKKMNGYDFIIQSQLVENYHIWNKELKEFLDSGNISLSSASISFEHPNFYYDPLFNLNHFYYFYGFNYINYYKSKNDKLNLIGIYHKDGGKSWRDELFYEIKFNLENELNTFSSKDYTTKKLFEPYRGEYQFGFDLWGLNHISGYIDYKTTACNLIFETLQQDANNEREDDRMFGRRYITEKTTKAICFGEENIFFIWYGPQDIYEYLIRLGFWFYNSEFYKGSIKESVIDSTNELKNLKTKLGDNNSVYEYLKTNYGHKLENNVQLFYKMLNCYHKKDEVINLIKNGKRN